MLFNKIILQLAFTLIFCSMVLSVMATPNDSLNNVEMGPHPAKTLLSEKAAKLKLGMTKAQVIKLLGPPTWADSDKGITLSLAWRNGKCNPVVVTFDKDLKVDGWDEGRVECFTYAYPDEPNDKYLCSNPKNKSMCTVADH